MKALVVVADPTAKRKIESFFTLRNHAIELRSDADAAMEAVEQTFFQFLIVDLTVPGDALELVRSLRRRVDGERTFVLVMPETESAQDLRRALEAGADDYLPRPIQVNALQLRLALSERSLAARQQRLGLDQQIEERDRRYRTLVATMSEGLLQVDEAGIIRYANSRLSSLTGFTLDELVGQSADDLLVDAEFRERLPGRTLLGPGMGSEEYTLPLRTKSGTQVWVKLTGAPISGSDGQPASLAVVQDITEQRAAEEGLLHREEYFRALLENSSDLISILDPDGRVLFQSLSSARLLGQPSEEVVGQDLRSLLHPEDHGVFDQALEESLGEPGGTASVQVRFRHRGGDWCYFESLCKNLVDNPVLGGVVITSRDVTERRQVEIALKRERAFFQQLFRNSPAGIVILDTNDRVVDANRSFVDLFQFEIQDLAGKPLNDSIVPVDLLDEASELSRLVQENQSIDRETIRSRKDGSKVDVSILGYPIELAERRIGAYGIYSDITERKSAERQLFHEAFHDPLTGLPNRALMTERLERDLRRAKRREDYQFALLFIDLDGFKAVNDNLGHAAGDELLVEVAQRLGACLRPGDTVARLGGDEFTIILEDIKEPGDATRIAGRILESLAQPFPIAGQEVRSAGSIGIAYSSTGYGQAEDLLRDADIAMYRAKTHGKARFEIFDTAMQETARQKQSLEVALGHALERGEIVLVYQPVVSLRGGALTGFEALARWRHPEKGLLLPAQWLPIALETKGLLEAVSQRVVSEACLQLAAWQKAFPERDAVRLSINVAPREASLGGWAQDLSAACKAAGCHPGSLVLEFTEELLARENSGGPELLWDLHKHGFRIWLDDFGTGRTSLDALSRLPIDAVKLDRMFVGALTPGTDSAEVARAVVALGHALGMVTVAEGVEQTDQADQLETLGIELAQGFHFSEPVDAAAATEMLATDRRW